MRLYFRDRGQIYQQDLLRICYATLNPPVSSLSLRFADRAKRVPGWHVKTLLLIPVLALALAACGRGGDPTPPRVTVPGAASSPLPTVSLAANPTSVTSGGSSTLTWSSTDATSCLASGAWSGPKSTSDNQPTGALTASGSYSLTCTGSGGSAGASATVTVSGTPPPPPAASAGYSTNFNLTENPISEGGRWINGKAVGLDWNNPLTVPGRALASVNSGLGLSRYDDSIAHLSTSLATYSPNQYAQGTVYKAAGYTTSGSHEVELLLRFQITAHNARGYEVLWGIAGYIAIVRWNGPLGNYTPLLENVSPGIGAPVDGDVLRAEITGNTITVYKNGSLVATASDSTQASGQPGMGLWPIDGATAANLGWKSYQAGNL